MRQEKGIAFIQPEAYSVNRQKHCNGGEKIVNKENFCQNQQKSNTQTVGKRSHNNKTEKLEVSMIRHIDKTFQPSPLEKRKCSHFEKQLCHVVSLSLEGVYILP